MLDTSVVLSGSVPARPEALTVSRILAELLLVTADPGTHAERLRPLALL